MTAMNCDQVFDVLTRGPFPTGTSCDGPVETHLSACPACRRLAEALRPAVELFQEAVDPEESRDLPGYWTAAAADRQTTAFAPHVESHRAARPRGAEGALPEGRPKPEWSALAAWRMAAMLALGVTLGTLLAARNGIDAFDWSPFAADDAPPAAAPGRPNPGLSIAERIELAALPAACYRDDAPQDQGPGWRAASLPAAADARLHCCSGCHHAASDAVPKSATVKVAASCQLCHHDHPSRRFEHAP